MRAGTYTLSKKIILKNEVVLRGLGSKPFHTRIESYATDRSITTEPNTSGIEIRNLEIDGKGKPSFGVLLYRTRWSTIENVIIKNVYRMPIGVADSNYVHIWDSNFNSQLSPINKVDSHIWVDNSNELWIARNKLSGKPRNSYHEGDGGIGIYGSKNVRIYDNQFSYAGIYLAKSSISKTQNARVWGNTFHYTNEWAVDVVEGTEDVLIASNTMTNGYHGAIVLWNVSRVEVKNNTMNNNNQGGHVACQGVNIKNSTNINVHNNTANPSPEYCIVN